MGADPIKTWGAGEAQTFDAELEPAAEQERLNRVLKAKAPRPKVSVDWSPESAHGKVGQAMDAAEQAGIQSHAPAVIVVLFIPSSRQQLAPHKRAGIDATIDSGELNVWDLATANGHTNLALPPEVAQCCYGRSEQTVTIRLHRAAAAGIPGMFESRVEVSPSPMQTALRVLLPFADGSQRELTVPVPHERRSSAWSWVSEPLPGTAFGGEAWQGNVELRGIKGDASRFSG